MDDRLALAIKYYQSNLDSQAAALVAEILSEDSPPSDAITLAATLAFERQSYAEAIAHCDHLIRLGLLNGHTLLLKGRALSDLGKHADAVFCLEEAVAVEPDLAAAHYNLGWVRSRLGDGSGAIAAYRDATARQNPYPVAWNNLGLELERSGDGEGAVAAFRTAIEQFPEFSMAHNNLGAVLAATGHYRAAEMAYSDAIKVDPDNVDAHTNLGVAKLEQADIAGAVAAFNAVLSINPQHSAAIDNRLYADVYRADDDAALRVSHGAAGDRMARQKTQFDWGVGEPDKDLRVGFLSPDFRRHSVSFFALPLIKALTETSITPVLFIDVVSPDETTNAYRNSVRDCHDVVGLDDEAVSQVIRNAGVDILVDLAGRTTGNRLSALASRVAPVQVMALGYPGPTGLAEMDYWLCDSVTNPIGLEVEYDRDRPLRLSRRLHVFAPSADAPAVGPLPALNSSGITFGSFNKLAKISDETAALWAQVLTAVSDSKLVLKAKALIEPETASHLRGRFEALGVEGHRIDARGWASADRDHLATYADVDIALDTFPYNGTTTTCEALWMGVPVISLSGRGHAARVGASILSSCDMSDWVAETPQDYVSIAASRAGDWGGLSVLRQSLRNSLAEGALTDASSAAHDLERTLRRAWVERCQARG